MKPFLKAVFAPLSLTNIKLLIWVFWGLGAWGLSNILSGYEAIMNYGAKLSVTQMFLTGASPSSLPAPTKTNLFNEGPLGYFLLALIGFFCFMCAKELLSFQKHLCSLANGENTLAGGEKEI